jgi:hypothetical protein
MQHIHAELLRCESELRFLQGEEAGERVTVAEEWKRIVYFFTALQAPDFLMDRLTCSEGLKKRIIGVLKKVGAEIDRDAEIMNIGWGRTTGATILIDYVHDNFLRYTWKDRGQSSERSIPLTRQTLVTLVQRIIGNFDPSGADEMTRCLVDTFYGPRRGMTFDGNARSTLNQLFAFFKLLADKNFDEKAISGDSDVNKKIRVALRKITYEFGAQYISFDSTSAKCKCHSHIGLNAIEIIYSHQISTPGGLSWSGRKWNEQPPVQETYSGTQSLVSFVTKILECIDDTIPPNAAMLLVEGFY